MIGNFCFDSVLVAKHLVSRMLHMRRLLLHLFFGFLNSCSVGLNGLNEYTVHL